MMWNRMHGMTERGISFPFSLFLDRNGYPLVFNIAVFFGILYLSISCVYMVKKDENATVRQFGKYIKTTTAGIHFKLPYPVNTSRVVPILDLCKA